ncbi:SIR2 family protein [Peribacillus simplex]|uniref:SIR2 family protein n=1 Tax=Peribacillus simplex TaxID=1478 RepID=UPI003D2BEE65
MDFKEILHNIYGNSDNRNPIGEFHLFEVLITRILQEHLVQQNKPVIINYKRPIEIENRVRKYIEYDVFAPEGFDQFSSSTAFQIKFLRDKRSVFLSICNFLRRYEIVDDTLKNIVFVFLIDLSEEEKKQLENKVNDNEEINNSLIYIIIWDINNLTNLFAKYEDLYKNLSKNISELLFETTVQNSLHNSGDDWKVIRDNHIEDLKASYYNDDLVLFLGAGVSVDAKIATWDTLISQLLVSLVSKELEKHEVDLSIREQELIIKTIKKNNGNSPLQLVRYIRHGLKNFFVDRLSEVLYKGSTSTTETLKAICRLCSPIRNGIGIQGVVTYNFDDLIEENFKSHDIKFKSIYREADLPSKNELGIFHVHGFLPKNKTEYDGLSDSLLVFSEEGYHNLMLDPYHWSNLVQLNYFKEHTCLFIGVSLTDPNIRRLLEISMSKQSDDKCKHYIILKRESLEVIKEQEGVDNNNIEIFEKVNQVLKEDSLKELGLNIIWIEDFPEIPEILNQIRG